MSLQPFDKDTFKKAVSQVLNNPITQKVRNKSLPKPRNIFMVAAATGIIAYYYDFSSTFSVKCHENGTNADKNQDKNEKNKSELISRRYYSDVRLSGKTIIITGANRGMGRQLAEECAKRGGRVIMACRNEKKCEAARKEIMKKTYNKQVVCQKLDLASFKSIRRFAEDIKSKENHVDILVNNAAIVNYKREVTEDGLEMMMQVNHFGRFLLSYLLVDKLKMDGGGRIVNQMGRDFDGISHIDFDDLNLEKSYDAKVAFGLSQLSHLLSCHQLMHEIKDANIPIYMCNPEIVNTDHFANIWAQHPFFVRPFIRLCHWVVSASPEKGIATAMYCAAEPQLQTQKGFYYQNMRDNVSIDFVKKFGEAARMYIVCLYWTGIKDLSHLQKTASNNSGSHTSLPAAS